MKVEHLKNRLGLICSRWQSVTIAESKSFNAMQTHTNLDIQDIEKPCIHNTYFILLLVDKLHAALKKCISQLERSLAEPQFL